MIELTENISNRCSRQGGEEGGDKCVLKECHVLELTGGVQLQTRNCREKIGEKIHL